MTDTKSSTLRARFAERYGLGADEVFDILKKTAFRQKGKGEDDHGKPTPPPEVSDAELLALLVICEQYQLNPFLKEIFAYPDKGGGIIPIVSLDGWTRIINSHPQFDGMTFAYAPDLIQLAGLVKPIHEWTDCTIWRHDRSHPIIVREYAIECYRPPFVGKSRFKEGETYQVDGPWQTHPRRMLRHKSQIQCARIAFGFAGLHDQDEAERMIDMGVAEEVRDGDLMPRALANDPSPVANFIDPARARARPRETVAREEPEDAFERSAAEAPAPAGRAAARGESEPPRRPAARPKNPPPATEENSTNGQPSMFADEGTGAPLATPVPANMLGILKRKLDIAGKNEVDMQARFGHGLDGVTKANFAEIQAWATGAAGAA